jgi:hypothetical protein
MVRTCGHYIATAVVSQFISPSLPSNGLRAAIYFKTKQSNWNRDLGSKHFDGFHHFPRYRRDISLMNEYFLLNYYDILRAIAQAVSRWLPTEAARVQTRV